MLSFLNAALESARGADLPAVQIQIPQRAARERCGSEIFRDASVLSLKGNMSCASCHDPDVRFGLSDGREKAVGDFANPQAPLGILGQRNTMTLFNVGSKKNKPCDWDGRFPNLYSQVLQAVTDPTVLAMPSIQAMVERVASRPRYQQLMQLAYGSPGVSEARIRDCLVFFLETIRYDDLPADRLATGEESGLPDGAIRGWELFSIHCASCHQPDNDWRDDRFHNIGISSRSSSNDRLRGAITNRAADNYAAATPTLRGLAHTAPYMHDGSLKDLPEVMGFFAAGGTYIRPINGVPVLRRDPDIDPAIKTIALTQAQSADLVMFLELGFQRLDRYPR